MTRKQRRITLITAAGMVIAIAAAIILSALEDTIVFFRSPTDIATEGQTVGERFRLGGLVEEGSVTQIGEKEVRFTVTDTSNSVTVTYAGILPDLFREGQGVVTEGVLDAGGLDRRITVRRLPAVLDTARLTETLPIDIAPGIERALWVRVTTADGHQAWSSPTYVLGDG